MLGTDVPQTSDGVAGPIARPVPAAARTGNDTSLRAHWQVAPGATVTSWDTYSARGPVRMHLLAVDWKQAGLRLDYLNAGAVARTAQVSSMVAQAGAIAGVNGDFFDIGDTSAPLGIGRDRTRGLLNGRVSGWNSAFWVNARGVPDIGPLTLSATVPQRPALRVAGVNPAVVPLGSVAAYTRHWGTTSGTRIVDGQQKQVRMLAIERGRVVRNTNKLPQGKPIRGWMLVGRGAGARQLVSIPVGTKLTLRTRVQGAPKVAITGNKFLVLDGVIQVVDDREMHPRTAVGIDLDTHQMLFLVVDGRQSFSRGYTMVELANLMIELGADEALNLDGGGSSTLVARTPSAKLAVVNSPSDGFQRRVANGLGISISTPARRQKN